MTFACADLEETLRRWDDLDPETSTALAAHAASCAACRAEVDAWRAISEAAPHLRTEWASPSLWPRIQAAISERAPARRGLRAALGAAFQPSWRLAAAAVLVLTYGGALFVYMQKQPAAESLDGGEARLLTERALAEAERAEAGYVKSIDSLAALAAPRIEQAASPLLLSYREKLLLLDTAIAECRQSLAANRFNTDLSRELLALYQEKQRTLRDILKENT